MASDVPADDWEAFETVTEQQERPAHYAQSASIDIISSELNLPGRDPISAVTAGGPGSKEQAGVSGRPGGGSHPEGIDEAVYDALLNQKTRSTVLRFEADVLGFIDNEEETELRFPLNLTGYQRLLCHRVAQHHGLETTTMDTGGEHHGKILVVKPQQALPVKEEVKEDDKSEEQKEEETSEEPAVAQEKLADVKIPEPSAEEQQQEAPKLLKKRSSASDRYSRPGGPIAEAAKTVTGEFRSVQEREHDYHLARDRIFNSQSQWPERYPGRGAPGRGIPSGGGMAGRQGLAAPSLSGTSVRSDYGNSLQAAAAASRGKAVFRNRQEELKDPDFQRDPSRYGPRFVPQGDDEYRHPQAMYTQRSYYDEFPGLGGPSQQRPPYPQQRGNVASAAQMMGALSLQQSQEAHAAAFMQPGMHYPGMHPGMHMAGYPGMPLQMTFVPGPGGVPQSMQQMQGMGMYGSPQMQYPNMPMHAPYGYLPARPGQEGMIPMMPGPMPPGMVPIYGGYPGQGYQVPMMPGQQMAMQQMHASPPNRQGSLPPNSPAQRRPGNPSFTRQMRVNSSSSITSTANSQHQQGTPPATSSESIGGNPAPPREPRAPRR